MTNVLASNRKAAARKAADEVLRKYRGFGETFEVLQKIAKDEGIEVLEADLSDISGALRREDGRWRAYINRQDSPTRQVFTLAHELGHYFLHGDERKEFVDGEFVMSRNENTKFDTEELEANEFAGSLVMPAERIAHTLKDRMPEAHDVLKLADTFHVSPLAMAIRLRSLGYDVPSSSPQAQD